MPITEASQAMLLVSAVALVDIDGRVLLAQRPEGKSMAGLWEFPGGKIEAGETAEHALEREILEELEITIEVGDALPASSYDYDFGTVVLHPFRASILSGVINLTEHPEGRWVSRRELPRLQWVPADIPIMQALLTNAG
jgi:8-oxo-dGTP diphosphatase